MTNQDDNAIMVMPVQEDGTLAEGEAVSTGGQGGVMIDPETGEEVATDALASQSAMRVAGDNLFAVNAGSNSLTMMAINPEDPLQLAMVGEPVETGGDVSVNCLRFMQSFPPLRLSLAFLLPFLRGREN